MKVSPEMTVLELPTRTVVFTGCTEGTKLRRGSAPCLIIGPGDLSQVHAKMNRWICLKRFEQKSSTIP